MTERTLPSGVITEPSANEYTLPDGVISVAAVAAADDVFFQNKLHGIHDGLRPVTAAGLNGVLVT